MDGKLCQKHYNRLHQLSTEARLIEGITSHLHWDQETYLPSGAAEIRAAQLKAMTGLQHQKKTSRRFANAIDKLIDLKTGLLNTQELTPPQAAAVKCWRRDYLQDVAIPKHFVETFSVCTSQSVNVWRQARKSNDFSLFAPFLERVVTLARKKADFLGYQDHPYDALLNLYEPDTTTKEIDHLFDGLKKKLAPIIKRNSELPTIDDSFLFGDFPQDRQLAFSKKILEDMGYPFSMGRLDLSTHPFSAASHPTDSRITTRIHPTGLLSNISSVLHEAGHALYEMGLPIEHYGSPLCQAVSFGIHESQSRWWETRIGLSKPFWHYYLPVLKQYFKGKLDNISLDDFYRAINKVESSFVRIESDELTYPLHIVLRFDIEKRLIEGSLKVKDLPDAWNSMMNKLFGITPPTDAQGVLQDIHWSGGDFGYFPSYALGNMYASHLFLGFEKKYHDWKERVAAGNLIFIKEWLHDNVFVHGRSLSSKELLLQATGHPFSEDAYINYLSEKY